MPRNTPSEPEHNMSKATSSAQSYSIIDLFAGCGGLSLGFETSGFTPVFVNEINNWAELWQCSPNTYKVPLL